jgi:phenylpyruvate tautomerase PptA (4-oxalocrotonate tautomerase family)
MPLVRIDVQQGRSPAALRKLADTVQDVMLDVFAAPAGDRYQVITEHPVGQIIAEDTGLGYDRSEGVTVIQIFQQGRSVDHKTAAYAELPTSPPTGRSVVGAPNSSKDTCRANRMP